MLCYVTVRCKIPRLRWFNGSVLWCHTRGGSTKDVCVAAVVVCALWVPVVTRATRMQQGLGVVYYVVGRVKILETNQIDVG